MIEALLSYELVGGMTVGDILNVDFMLNAVGNVVLAEGQE